MKKSFFRDKSKNVYLIIDLDKQTYKINDLQLANNLMKSKIKEIIKLGFKEN